MGTILWFSVFLFGFSGTIEVNALNVTVSVFEWTINPLNIRADAESDVRVRVNVTSSSISDNLNGGRRLWRLAIFGSASPRGDGVKYDYRRQILNRREESLALGRRRKIKFDILTKFELRGLGQSTAYPYMCVEFTKGDNPSPYFNLFIDGQSVIVSCQLKPSTENAAGGAGPQSPFTSLNMAIFSRLEWTHTLQRLNRNEPSNVHINLQVEIASSSDNVAGQGLWRLSLFGSNTADGTGRKINYVQQILSDEMANRNLDTSETHLVLDCDTSFDLRRITCDNSEYTFLCIEFAKGDSPIPNYDFPLYGDGGLVSCQEIRCYFDANHHEGPVAQISSFSWGLEPFSIRRGEQSDLMVTLNAAAHPSTDIISGRNLWRVGIFGAETEDGGGTKYGYQSQLLDSTQARMRLAPGSTLSFTMNTRFDMSVIGCAPVNYFCIEFGKGMNPNPDFMLPTSSNDGMMTACKARDCPFPEGGAEHLDIASFQRFSFSAIPQSTQSGITTLDVAVTGSSHPSSDTIEGTGLWRLGVFGSRNADGSDTRRNERRQILDSTEASQTLAPGGDLVLSVSPDLDLRGIGTNTDFPYLCVEFAKGDRPDPDFTLGIQGDSIIQCSNFEGAGAHGPQAVIARISGSVGTVGAPFADGTSNVRVRATLTPHDQSDRIDGSNLWNLGIFGSRNSDGSGPRYHEVPQILYPQEASQSLIPGSTLEFDVTRSADIRGIGAGTSYPYICMEFAKNDHAQPDFNMQNSIVMCQELREQTANTDFPQALFNQFSYMVDGIPSENNRRDSSRLRITTSATLQYDSDSIPTGDNWRLGVFGSRNSDGSGPRRHEDAQILPRSQYSQGAVPGSPLLFDVTLDLDLRNIGTGSPYPYLCMEFDQMRDANFNMPQTFIGCDEITGGTSGSEEPNSEPNPEPEGTGGNTGDMRNVIIENYRGGFIQEAPTDARGITQIRITATLTPHSVSDSLSGTGLWRLGVFGSETQDGQGNRRKESTQVLSQRHASYPMYPPRPLDFDFVVPLDLRGVGRNTRNPYLCLEFAKGPQPNPDFNLQLGGADSIILCTKPNGNYNPPESSVNFESLRGRLQQTGQQRADGTTPMSISVSLTAAADSESVNGQANWRLGIFGSQNANGAGTRKREVTQVLGANKASLPVRPGRELSITTSANVNLRGIGASTEFPFLCMEFAKGDNPRPDFNMGDPAILCSEWEGDSDTGNEQISVRAQVYIKTIKPAKVTINENRANDLTFDTVVNYDSARTNNVSGDGTWQLSVWGSKKKNGKGPKVSFSQQALSSAQQNMPLNRNAAFRLRDVNYDLDMRGEICKNVKYLCATLSSTTSSVKVKGKNIGCIKLKCKKSKSSSRAAMIDEILTQNINQEVLPSITARRVRTSTVTIREGRSNDIAFTTDVSFTGNPIQGTDLWRLAAWFSAEPDGGGPKVALSDQTLSRSQRSLEITYPLQGVRFPNVRMTADLSGTQCGDISYLCTRLKKGYNPDPDFELVTGSNTGCVVIICAQSAVGREDIVMPLISPTQLQTTSAIVSAGQINSLALDVTIDFDFAHTQIVDGRDLWKVIVWLSDSPDGKNKIGRTEQALTDMQKNQLLLQGYSLLFKNVRAEIDLTNVKCKKVSYVCAKFKSFKPKPRFLMKPSHIIGCSPCYCH